MFLKTPAKAIPEPSCFKWSNHQRIGSGTPQYGLSAFVDFASDCALFMPLLLYPTLNRSVMLVRYSTVMANVRAEISSNKMVIKWQQAAG